MGTQVEWRCRCGEVRALVVQASPRTVNRVICYCDDCQAFAHRLGRADVLDAQGGTDIVQVAPATFSFVQGTDHIAALRLTPKGLLRWHTTCCNTPLGNTLRPTIPFIGLIAPGFDTGARSTEEIFGAPVAGVMAKFAIGEPPAGSMQKMSVPLFVRVLVRIFGWRLRGQAWPNAFFRKGEAEPIFPVVVLSREQRDALRPLCGPTPTTVR